MLEKIKAFAAKLNELGIPLPFIRDPKTAKSSVTLTMLWISFNIVVLGTFVKWSKMAGDIDMTNAMYLFGTTSALYLGRKMQADNTTKTITVEKKEENDPS